MPRKKTEQTGRFVVLTDDDDKSVDVFIWKDLIDVSTSSEPNKWLDGKLKTLLTADGDHVNNLGDDEYEILYSMGSKRARKVGSHAG